MSSNMTSNQCEVWFGVASRYTSCKNLRTSLEILRTGTTSTVPSSAFIILKVNIFGIYQRMSSEEAHSHDSETWKSAQSEPLAEEVEVDTAEIHTSGSLSPIV